MFSYGSAPIVPSVEKSMTDKSKFGRALGLAYVAAVFFKLSFSIFGFLSFSFSTDEIVTNNLPNSVPHMVVSVVFVLSCLFSYALPLQSVFQYIEDSSTYGRLQRKVLMPQVVYTVGIRVLLVSITLAAAAYIPHFGLLSSFFGNLSLPLFNCILPCVAHLILRKEDLKRREVCLDYVVIVFGALVTIFGTIVSTKALIETLRK